MNNLKEKLDIGSKVTEENYQKAIAECIEEIRYLFKSVDYKYENELRILRYANLDPSNDKIKIDKTSGIGKLYVERENSIQIDEVIFGPKFPNPEYVTPLLKLLDKEINYKKSTIKFR
ncbi:conserved domain protein [Streptococcus oralis SK255]|uniref:Conserved domain protein n=1 Tax=Streptococcus oralis SK255 TaxID=1005704 RepID=F5VUY3_STROR|nr:conserved domain protein [Streptococcus oralis SK255]